MPKSVTLEQESTITNQAGQLMVIIQKRNHEILRKAELLEKKKVRVTMTFEPIET